MSEAPPPPVPEWNVVDYVEVRDEPNHRHQHQGDNFRVYDVFIPPSTMSLAHRHSEDTVYFFLSSVKQYNSNQGDAVMAVPNSVSVFMEHKAEPLIHQVKNIHPTETFRAVGCEIHTPAHSVGPVPILAHAIKGRMIQPEPVPAPHPELLW